jgi:signal transduction histidine kinase
MGDMWWSFGRTRAAVERDYRDLVKRPVPISGRLGIDLLVVLAALSAAVGTALRQDPLPTEWALWWEIPAIALAMLTLLGRYRFPFAAAAAVWLICGALSFIDGGLVPSQPAVLVAGLGAALLLGNLRDRRLALVGLALCVGVGAIVVENKPVHPPSELVFTPMMFAICWLAGYALRERTLQTEAAEERAAHAERDRETAARLAVAEERTRIARELHDVVAHALSVMVLHVGVARRRTPDGQQEMRETLENVEHAGRDALAEMRRLLDAMRGEDEALVLAPQPGLGDLPALAEEIRATGLDVRLLLSGDGGPLPAVLDLSAYRVVQEGLTNVLKHARARRVEVEVRLGPTDVLLEVRDDGRGVSANGAAPGYGLIGIRERVSLLGGEMSAGDHPGGYVLRARLPREATP